MSTDNETICTMLRQFASGTNRSRELAGKLEVALDREYPNDDECQELVLALASYEPGGGEFLFDENAIAVRCKHLAMKLCDGSSL
jgi:hypothetical protein